MQALSWLVLLLAGPPLSIQAVPMQWQKVYCTSKSWKVPNKGLQHQHCLSEISLSKSEICTFKEEKSRGRRGISGYQDIMSVFRRCKPPKPLIVWHSERYVWRLKSHACRGVKEIWRFMCALQLLLTSSSDIQLVSGPRYSHTSMSILTPCRLIPRLQPLAFSRLVYNSYLHFSQQLGLSRSMSNLVSFFSQQDWPFPQYVKHDFTQAATCMTTWPLCII